MTSAAEGSQGFSPGESRPWRPSESGLIVSVRLTPKGGRDAVDGAETLSDGRTVLKARVRAAPENGKANESLARILANCCEVGVSRVSLVGGATSRVKTWLIEGDATVLAAALERSLASSQRKTRA